MTREKTSILTRPEDPVYKPILEIIMFFCSSLYQPAVHGGGEGSSSQIFVNEGNFEEGKIIRRQSLTILRERGFGWA